MRVSPVSASVAVTTAPTFSPAAVFSATERLTAEGLNTGALLVGELVLPVPEADQSPSPSSLWARTCTW